MKITYATINKFEPRFLPGDKVWEIGPDLNPREVSISSVECFYTYFRYNVHPPKDTLTNWFTEDHIDIMDDREEYPASAVWSSEENVRKSFIFWLKRKNQAEKELEKLAPQPTP